MTNQNLIDLLTKHITQKKILSNLDTKYIQNKTNKFFLTNGNILKKLKNQIQKKGIEKIEKNKLFKQTVKNIRDELRIVYTSFLDENYNQKENLLKQNNTQKILTLHKSTKERLPYNEEIYTKIFQWYKPKKIADLACGLNPLTYNLIEKILKYKPKYIAYDLAPKDINFLNTYFKQNKIPGKAKQSDLTTLEFLKDQNFQTADLVFLLKALDSFEHVKKNLSKKILTQIPANHIIVSFPTKSLLAKKGFRIEKRNWIFNFIKKQNWNFEKFETKNELIIMINKNSTSSNPSSSAQH